MSVKKNFTYNVLYQILTIAIPIFTTPYISRTLGADALGQFSYAYSVTYYFILFAMLGVNNYGSRTIAAVRDDKNELSKTFWEIYVFQILLSIFSAIFYIVYIEFFCEDKLIGYLMVIYLIGTALDINWLFFGLEKFKITVTRNAIIKIATVVLIFLFIKIPEDVYLYTIFYAGGMLVSQLILWTFLSRYIKFTHITIHGVIRHIKPNVVLFIPVIAISLYKTMDKIMLGNLATTVEVGYYTSCEKLLAIPNGFITALGTVVMPRVSNLSANKQDDKARDFFYRSIIFSIACTSVMSFGIMGIAREFVPVFYGKGFDECIAIFQFLMPSCLFVGIANVVRTQYLIPYKKDKTYIISTFLGALVNLIANYILIPKYNAVGAAIGTLLAEAIVCIYQSVITYKQTGIILSVLRGFPFVIMALIMYFFIFNLNISIGSIIITLIIKIIIGGALFCIPAYIYLRKFLFKN